MIKSVLLVLLWLAIYLLIGGGNILMVVFIISFAVLIYNLSLRDRLNLNNLLIINTIGAFYLITYSFNYNNLLSPYGDDALFLIESKNIDLSFFSIYPTILKLIRIFTDVFSFADQDFLFVVYLISWIFYAKLINLSYKVFEKIVKVEISFALYSAFLMGLYLIQWSFIHVYRDLALFYLIFLGLHYFFERKMLIVLIICIPIFFLRGATFFSVFLASILYRHRHIFLNGSTVIVKAFKISLLCISAFVLSGAFVFIVPFISRFGNLEGNDSNATLSSFLENRTNFVEANENIQDQVTYKVMQQSWPVKIIVLPVINIVTPVKYLGLKTYDKRVSFKFQVQYVKEYLDFSNLFQISHLFILSVFLPLLAVNGRKYLSFSSESFTFVIICIIFLMSISFISFVPRHRILFLIPLSAIAATRFKDYDYAKLRFTIFFIFVALVVYNIINI